MDITLSEVITWIIIGALVGPLAGMVARGKKGGFGYGRNLLIGLVGAVIGGFLFNLFDVDLGLGEIKVTLENLVAAFLGTLLFLGVVWFVRRGKKPAT